MKIEYDGKIFKSWKALAAAHGITYTCWQNRVFNAKWDRARAATTPVHTVEILTAGGVTGTRAEHAKRIGISEASITKRLQRGMDLATALTEPPRRKVLRYTQEERIAARRAEQAAKVARNKAAISGYKAITPCKDCHSKFHPDAMEFDHVPERGPKHRDISRMLNSSLEKIITEMRKCDLVCANCHRIRTFSRRK
jgi:hypothetical protein